MLAHSAITEAIIGAAIEVRRLLGPGLLESAYQRCMYHELLLRGIAFQKELALPVQYKGTNSIVVIDSICWSKTP